MKPDWKQSCDHNEFSYKFSADMVNFNQALDNCKKYGGWLASDLDNDVYETINNCSFFDGGQTYFIGLAGGSKNCSNSSRPFRWVKSRNCTDGSPFKLIKPQGNQRCVNISQQTSNLPRAQVTNCRAAKRYICQTKIELNTTPKIQSTKFKTNKPTEMTSDKIASFSMTAVHDSVGPNTLLIPSLVIAFVLLIFLLALILICFLLYKRDYFKGCKTKNKLATSKNCDLKELRNNPLYDG